MKKRILLNVIVSIFLFLSGYGCSYIINNYYDYEHEICSHLEDDANIPDYIKDIRNSKLVIINEESTYRAICEDVFYHVEEYLDKPMEVTGYYHSKKIDNQVCHFVGKFISSDNVEYIGDSQSNTDEWYGFEFLADNIHLNENDKITVNGIFGEYEENGEDFITLKECTISKIK